MRRVIIMGPPGSGKSTLARQLSLRHGLPVFHLDQAWHRPGWIEAARASFRAEVERIAALPEWVIDGNYIAAPGPRFRAADTLIYLDVPIWLCMVRIIWRTATHYGRVRDDSAPGCRERFDPGFLRFVWTWNRARRAMFMGIAGSFPGKTIILRPGLRERGEPSLNQAQSP